MADGWIMGILPRSSAGGRVKYDEVFFDYLDEGAIRSAKVVVGRLFAALRPSSVLDVGCGRGGWLSAWKQAGSASVLGIDGDYVDRGRLHVSADNFHPVDLSAEFDLGRRFDLVQCLEVAEHIAPAGAAGLINSIVRHGDVVLFSAAVPGQGGTTHVNERPLDYWRELFAEQGYMAFDALRPHIHADTKVGPWYRFNTILYANAVGEASLPADVRAAKVADGVPLADFSSLSWRLRKAVLRRLSVGMVDRAAIMNARLHRLLRSTG